MNTNPSSGDKDIFEINKNRSETVLNEFRIAEVVILSIIALLNVLININLNKVNQKLEDAKFFETTIDHLAADAENREIALSILYSLYILEEKPPKHRDMLIDISETILETNISQVSQEKNIPISKKALKIIEALDPEKLEEMKSKIAQTPESKTDPNLDTSEKSIDKSTMEKNNAFVSALLKTTEQAKDEKKGLVFIQYNNQSKREDIDKFRETLSQEWNAPGIEFIAEYNSPSGKYGDVRFFHTDEEELANQLQATLNQKYCPEKPEGCFVIRDLSENYPNLPKKQFEIWIDANKIP
ncbi:hypothetical protein GM3708_2869 [Geminocystis sp. NIES-3708]|uniref:hypothetical protein n=1 Tax=Geminocystis sp. NIES-3708 TaxID=1615909 RepID=UPI0005FC6717|nr:hypothetical protein [Geminocystis sp. NIES-3708]BAQ62463.1 hypothetical protein GM3708_2869 [Geminocystis sp. NIES-3708]